MIAIGIDCKTFIFEAEALEPRPWNLEMPSGTYRLGLFMRGVIKRTEPALRSPASKHSNSQNGHAGAQCLDLYFYFLHGHAKSIG